MITQRYILLLLMGTATIVGVSLFFLQRHAPTSSVPDLKIIRTSSGGLAGKGDGHNFTLSHANLTADQLKETERKINQAHFFTLESNYPATGCADGFITDLTITLNAQSKKVRFENCGQQGLPPGLLQLDNYLRTLAT